MRRQIDEHHAIDRPVVFGIHITRGAREQSMPVAPLGHADSELPLRCTAATSAFASFCSCLVIDSFECSEAFSI